MDVKELAALGGVKENSIRVKCKRTSERGDNIISVGDIDYSFTITTNKSGKVYEFNEVVSPESESLGDAQLQMIVPSKLLEIRGKVKSANDKLAIVEAYESMSVKMESFLLYLEGLRIYVSEGQVFRWRREFQSGGKRALKDKRSSNHLKIDKDVVREVLLAHGAIHKTNLHEMYLMKVAHKYGKDIQEAVKAPTIAYRTFARAMDQMLKEDNNLRLLTTKGRDALQSSVITFKRDDVKSPNQEWQIDATPLDFMVMAPESYLEDGEIKTRMRQKRMTVIAIIDVFSGRRVWGLYDSANSYANVRLLKKALLKLGKPKRIRGDNGKDYVSKHFQGALEELGITYITGRPYKGMDKGAIERNFKTMLHSSLELFSNFIGHNVSQREFLESFAVSKDKRLGGDKTYIDTSFESDVMELVIDKHIEMMDEKLGWSKKWGEFEPNHIDEVTINHAIGKRKVLTISREGVRYNKEHYYNPELMINENLFGKKCIAVENIDDISTLWIYGIDGEYIGEFVNRDLLELSAEQARTYQKLHTKALKAIEKESDNLKKESGLILRELYQLDKIKEEVNEKRAQSIKKESRAVMDYAAQNNLKDTKAFVLDQIEKQKDKKVV